MANWARCGGNRGEGNRVLFPREEKGGEYSPVLIFAGEAPLRSLRELWRLSFFRGVFGELVAGSLGRGQRLQQVEQIF